MTNRDLYCSGILMVVALLLASCCTKINDMPQVNRLAAPSFRIELQTWKSSVSVDEKGNVRKWWLERRAGDNTMRMDPSSFDRRTAGGMASAAQREQIQKWVEEHQEMLFGLNNEYHGEKRRYISSVSLAVGERSTVIKHSDGKLPAKAQAAVAALRAILKGVPVRPTDRAEMTIDPEPFRRTKGRPPNNRIERDSGKTARTRPHRSGSSVAFGRKEECPNSHCSVKFRLRPATTSW